MKIKTVKSKRQINNLEKQKIKNIKSAPVDGISRNLINLLFKLSNYYTRNRFH